MALRISADVERAIAGFLDPLRKLNSSVRWVRPANLHLTLRFLGDAVDRNLLSILDTALHQIATQSPPFMLRAHGTGAFPNLDHPRTIWIGLVGEQLMLLAHQVEGAATQTGFAREGRPYTPHLTVGRVRDFRGLQPIRELLRQSQNQDFGTSLISEMILYRSILGGDASHYQELARYSLVASQPL